jgi:type I restriction enzyme, S subunit
MDSHLTIPLDEALEYLIDYRGKSPTKSTTGIPVISAKVVKAGRIKQPIEQTIDPNYYPVWMTRGLPQVGDVVMTTEGPLGEVAQLDESTVEFALGQRVVCMKGKTEFLDSSFFKYLLMSPKQQNILHSYATGTTVAGISQKSLRSMPISIPSVNDQKKIGIVLSALDGKIENNRQMNETLEAMARAIFKSWFVDFEPVHAKAQGRQPAHMTAETAALFPDGFSDDGLPRKWKADSLNTFTQLQNGFAFKSSDWLENGVPVVKIGSVMPATVNLKQVSYVSDELAREKMSFRLKVGDALVGLTGYVGEVGRVPPTSNLPLLNQRVGRFSTNGEFSPFVYACVRGQEFKDFAISQSHGSAQANVSTISLLNFPVTNPGRDLLNCFNELTSSWNNKCLQALSEIDNLTELRDLLLPKLMSGEIRVGDAEEVVGNAT